MYLSTESTMMYSSNVVIVVNCSYNNNPSYVPSEPPVPVATNAEIETAVKNALESNNPALAAAIAGAIAAAYSPDQTDGQSISDSATNGLASSSNDDIKDAITTAANNDGTEP